VRRTAYPDARDGGGDARAQGRLVSEMVRTSHAASRGIRRDGAQDDGRGERSESVRVSDACGRAELGCCGRRGCPRTARGETHLSNDQRRHLSGQRAAAAAHHRGGRGSPQETSRRSKSGHGLQAGASGAGGPWRSAARPHHRRPGSPRPHRRAFHRPRRRDDDHARRHRSVRRSARRPPTPRAAPTWRPAPRSSGGLAGQIHGVLSVGGCQSV